MANQLLLLEDVENVGRSGDLVTVKPGYARNYLLPKKKALIADKNTLRMRTKLQEERVKKAAQDKKDAEVLAKHFETVELSTKVKADVEGRLYGSVAIIDVLRILEEAGFTLTKKNIQLAHPIKKIGDYAVELKLNEGVPASFKLKILPEVVAKPEEEETEPKLEEEKAEEPSLEQQGEETVSEEVISED